MSKESRYKLSLSSQAFNATYYKIGEINVRKKRNKEIAAKRIQRKDRKQNSPDDGIGAHRPTRRPRGSVDKKLSSGNQEKYDGKPLPQKENS